MYKVIYRSIRETLDVDFFPRSQPVKDLINQAKVNGKILEEILSLEDNALVERYMVIWDSPESSQEFNKNPINTVYNREWVTYSKKNNISINIIGELYDE